MHYDMAREQDDTIRQRDDPWLVVVMTGMDERRW